MDTPAFADGTKRSKQTEPFSLKEACDLALMLAERGWIVKGVGAYRAMSREYFESQTARPLCYSVVVITDPLTAQDEVIGNTEQYDELIKYPRVY